MQPGLYAVTRGGSKSQVAGLEEGAAELRSYGTAERRSDGATELQSHRFSELLSYGTAEPQNVKR